MNVLRPMRALFAVALLLGLCAPAQAEDPKTTILSGKIVSTVTRAESMPFNASVNAVLVKPGQKVAKGEVLLTYSLTEESQRSLDRELLNGANSEGIKSQMLALRSQQAELTAQSNKDRQLAAAGLGSRQASARSSSELQLLKERMELLQHSLKKQEKAFAQRLDELSDYYGEPISPSGDLPSELMLTSPMDGHVLSIWSNLQEGSLLGSGSAPILVGKMDPMGIQVQVFEGEIGRIKVGNKASVTIPSLGDKVFEATVSQISWTSSSMDVAQPSYFTVELTIPNPDLELKPGFKAVVEFSAQ